jgi:hypothetical protein
MDAISKVIRGWRDAGVALNPPATVVSMSKLAKLLDEPVPADLQRFYDIADGMPDHATDGWHLSFWSVERVLREQDFESDSLAIADVLNYSHCIRVRPIGGSSKVTVDGGAESFASLDAFFHRYLLDPGHFGLREAG